MRKLITDKIDEAIEIAELQKDNNVLIVLHTLLASIISGHDGILAAKVKEIAKELNARNDDEHYQRQAIKN